MSEKAVFTAEEVVQAIEAGEVSREEVREAMSASVGLPDTLAVRMVREWMQSSPPSPSTLTEVDVRRRATEIGGEVMKHTKRLRRAFIEDKKRVQCVWCRENNECMVVGCRVRPLDTSTERLSCGFRCILGRHFCGHHGLKYNTCRRNCPTDGLVMIGSDSDVSNARCVANIYQGIESDLCQKVDTKFEDTRIKKTGRITDALARLNQYSEQLGIGALDVEQGLQRVVDTVVKRKYELEDALREQENKKRRCEGLSQFLGEVSF